MDHDNWKTVDDYVADLLLPHDQFLNSALKSSAEAGLPAISVSPVQGKFLQLLALSIRAKRILEIGTLGGYSTIWLARALPSDGLLITLEADPKHAKVAGDNIAAAGLKNRVQIRLGKATDSLPKLQSEGKGPFDLIFIDADKTGYPEYLKWSLQLSHPGSLIIADNIVRKGEVANERSTDENVQAVRRYNELLAAEPRLSSTIIQTVGAKGHDGFALSLVMGE